MAGGNLVSREPDSDREISNDACMSASMVIWGFRGHWKYWHCSRACNICLTATPIFAKKKEKARCVDNYEICLKGHWTICYANEKVDRIHLFKKSQFTLRQPILIRSRSVVNKMVSNAQVHRDDWIYLHSLLKPASKPWLADYLYVWLSACWEELFLGKDWTATNANFTPYGHQC